MNLNPAQRRFRAALGLAVLATLTATAAGAHWLKPEEITAGLNQNTGLKKHAGLVSARADPDLPRLLIIKMKAAQWRTLPAEQRLTLAQQWYDAWRHNVDQGIVAVLDAETEKPLVKYDAGGTARLVEK